MASILEPRTSNPEPDKEEWFGDGNGRCDDA
jgi:hypothetical protein